MWKEVELKPREGLLLTRNGVYRKPKDIPMDDLNDIIGVCVSMDKVMSINISRKCIEWGSDDSQNILGIHNYDSKNNDICRNDMNGEYNTKCIVDHCKRNNIDLQKYYPATYYCTSYSPGYRDGEWYLPSVGELNLVYSNYNNTIMFLDDIPGIHNSAQLLSFILNILLYNVWSSTITYDHTWNEYNILHASCSYANSNRLRISHLCNEDKCLVIPFLKI